MSFFMVRKLRHGNRAAIKGNKWSGPATFGDTLHYRPANFSYWQTATWLRDALDSAKLKPVPITSPCHSGARIREFAITHHVSTRYEYSPKSTAGNPECTRNNTTPPAPPSPQSSENQQSPTSPLAPSPPRRPFSLLKKVDIYGHFHPQPPTRLKSPPPGSPTPFTPTLQFLPPRTEPV